MATQHGGLSKNLLRMKFMQRTALEAEKQQSLEDRVITSEEWHYSAELLAQVLKPDAAPLRGVTCRPDFRPVLDGAGPFSPVLALQPAAWGRISFGGFNPAVEKLMAECGRGGVSVGGRLGVSQAEMEAEAGATVSAEKLARRRAGDQKKPERKKPAVESGGLSNSLADKFATKRQRRQGQELQKQQQQAAAAVAEGGNSSPEEGEVLNEEEDETLPPSRRILRAKKRKQLKLKNRLQQLVEQQAEEEGNGELAVEAEEGARKKSKKKGKKQEASSKAAATGILPHPSTLLPKQVRGRKRKAARPSDEDD